MSRNIGRNFVALAGPSETEELRVASLASVTPTVYVAGSMPQ